MEQNTVEMEVSLEPFSFCVSALKAQEADPQVLWGFGCWAYSPFLHQLDPVLMSGIGATGHSLRACPGLALCDNTRNRTGRAL